jgi:hypothetical protein
MKLAQLHRLLEAAPAEPPRAASDLWAELEDGAKTYTPDVTLAVRPDPDKKGSFEVTQIVGTTRKPYAKMSADELDAALVPVRPGQDPDAEGYILYRDPAEVKAVKYDGDPATLDDGGREVRLGHGDYLVREFADGGETFYAEKTAAFERRMREV